MPSRQPRTIAATQPDTLRTMLGRASLKLTMNSRAAFRTFSFSTYDESSTEPFLSGGDAEEGGKANEPCGVGNGFATVGVGPQSTLGSMRAGRKDRSALRWGAKSFGADELRGVSVERNEARRPGEDWSTGRVESME